MVTAWQHARSDSRSSLVAGTILRCAVFLRRERRGFFVGASAELLSVEVGEDSDVVMGTKTGLKVLLLICICCRPIDLGLALFRFPIGRNKLRLGQRRDRKY